MVPRSIARNSIRFGSLPAIHQDQHEVHARRDLREQLKPFACQRGFVAAEAGDVPARLIEPRDDAAGDEVG
jgi:hypothetical protein